MATDSAKAQWRSVFTEFDTDGSGSISTSEIKALMERLGQSPSDEEVKEYVDEYDANGDGEIDYEEFVEMMTRQVSGEASQTQVLRESFKLVAGTEPSFGVKELKEILTGMGQVVPDTAIEAMMNEADKNGDGAIDLAEWRLLWKEIKA